MGREQEFELFSGLKFSDLTEVNLGARNATHYYHHARTNTNYSYYFGDKPGKWEIDPRLMRDKKSPKEPTPVEPNRNELADKKLLLEIKKLELEIRKLELEIVYIDTKTRNLDKKAKKIRTNTVNK